MSPFYAPEAVLNMALLQSGGSSRAGRSAGDVRFPIVALCAGICRAATGKSKARL